MSKTVIAVDGAPRPFAGAPYNQAIKSGGLVFCAGQVALDPESGSLIEGDVAAQTHRALQNLQAILEGAGSSLDRVVKTTCFLPDPGAYATLNALYAEYFPSAPPVRSAPVVQLPPGLLFSIEAVALG